MKPETRGWLNSLPAADDVEGWAKRAAELFGTALHTITPPDEPLPWDDEEDAS